MGDLMQRNVDENSKLDRRGNAGEKRTLNEKQFFFNAVKIRIELHSFPYTDDFFFYSNFHLPCIREGRQLEN